MEIIMSNTNESTKLISNAELLKILGHPVRLCIIENLIEKNSSNVTNMQNCLNVPQSTTSQHISKLKNAGIIVGVRNGLEINYSIADERVIKIINILNS